MSVTMAEIVTLDRRSDELPFPCQDSIIPECGLGTKKGHTWAEWPEGEMSTELLGGHVRETKLMTEREGLPSDRFITTWVITKVREFFTLRMYLGCIFLCYHDCDLFL